MQHEATGKHQGNLRRFLKGIQDGQERGEREKQRAKTEVDRLNKVVGGSAAGPSDHDGAANRKSQSLSTAPQVSVAERKKQIAQLVEMGIAVPDEFRGEMAMAGDWRVVSQRPVEETASEGPLSVGVRKRKHEGEEEEEEVGKVVATRGWGSTSRRYPVADEGSAPDLDALLSGVTSVKKDDAVPDLKNEESEEKSTLTFAKDEKAEIKNELETPATANPALVKKEESARSFEPVNSSLHDIPTVEEALVAGVVFKKRKPKSIREK